MKVLMTPVNISGQPLILVEGLRKYGIDAHVLQYTYGGSHPLGYRRDLVVDLSGKDRATEQIKAIKSSLDYGYDIFHFWLRTFFFGPPYKEFMGLDLPFIKARGVRIVYRFTGHDLRLPSLYKAVNPFNAYKYGFQSKFDEEMQKKYIDYLREYVDQFVVQDPEMHGYFPEATIIPRAINLEEWPYIGVQPTDHPLIVHAPTDPKFKGTPLILAAIEDLKAEGLNFSFKLIHKMKHSEAVEWYKKADIIVDQLHVGWYGILAMEGMALGKPVLVYIREDLQENYPYEIPVENVNPVNVKEKLKALIKDYDRRAALGKRARSYVEEVHDVNKVVPQLIKLYNDVLRRPPTQPTSFADLDYFLAQYQHRYFSTRSKRASDLIKIPKEELFRLRYKARKYDELSIILKFLSRLSNLPRKLLNILRGIFK